MDCHEIQYRYSWCPEDEVYWLWWCPGFPCSAACESEFSLILRNISTSISWISNIFLEPFMHPRCWILMTLVVPWLFLWVTMRLTFVVLVEMSQTIGWVFMEFGAHDVFLRINSYIKWSLNFSFSAIIRFHHQVKLLIGWFLFLWPNTFLFSAN